LATLPSSRFASLICDTLRYSIDKTSIDFNLTKSSQFPRIGRAALLAIVEWLAKYRDRSNSLESHGFGPNTKTEEQPTNQFIGSDSIEEIQNGYSRKGDN
jgi:hypothetical protein